MQAHLRAARRCWPLVVALVVACGGSSRPTHAPVVPAPDAPHAAAVDPAAPYSVVLVHSGEARWIGPDDDSDRGGLPALKAAIDQAELARTAPAGSRMAIVSYASRPLIRVPFVSIDRITGSVLGGASDYAGAAGSDLVTAVELAASLLDGAVTPRKRLIVVSDGTDSHGAAAVAQMAKLKPRITAGGIEVASIVLAVPGTASSAANGGDVLAALTDRSTIAATPAAATAAVVRALRP